MPSERFQIPESDAISVDLHSRRDLDLYDITSGSPESYKFLIGGTFDDDHDDTWWQQAHQPGQGIILLAANTPKFMRSAIDKTPLNFNAWLDDSHICRATLLLRGYSTGVGTRPSETE